MSRIPKHSPRHPRFQVEARRVAKLLESDRHHEDHEQAMKAEREAEKAYIARPKRKDEPEEYHYSRLDRPAKRDKERVIAVNPAEPKIKLRFRADGPPSDHPLCKAKGKLSPSEYEAGNSYRSKYESAFERGFADSTQAVMVDGRSRGGSQEWSADQGRAQEDLNRIDAKIGIGNARIIRKFCGQAYPMAQAVHTSVTCHRDGVLDRIREALQALSIVLGIGDEKKQRDERNVA